MVHPDYQPGSDDVTKQYWQCRCSWCELLYIRRGVEIVAIDLKVYQNVFVLQILVKRQESQSESRLSDSVISQLRVLGESLVSFNRSPEYLMDCQAHKASCSSPSAREKISWGGVKQKSKAGSKRALLETDMTVLQHVHGCFGSSISEAPLKRSKHFRARGRNPNRQRDANGGANREGSTKSACKVRIYINDKDKFHYNCKSIFQDTVPMPSLVSLGLAFDVCKTSSASTIFSIRNLPELHWLLEEEHPVSAKMRKVEVPSKQPIVTKWDSLPYDLQENILQRVDYKDIYRCKTLSKACKEYIESDAFCQRRGETSSQEGSFTAISYYIKHKAWQCIGYDLHSRTWRSLPTLSYLPAPDAELFKEYSICGHGSLMCAQVSKPPKEGELVVFNPLTGKKRSLPPLLYSRNPVLVHISVNSAAKSYKVIVAGSSTASDEHLSKKMEVFDSKTSEWREVCDLPGPVFGLNEHQAGVCVNGILYFIAFLEGNCCRGVVAFDLENGKWLENMACAIPFSLYSNTLQLVECNGKVYVFSEQERGGSLEHCIHVLEFLSLNARAGACHWENVVRVKKSGGRGLQVYPEHTCVSFGDGKLCVFNTLTRDGVVYDVQDGMQVEVLQPPPPNQKGEIFFSLNPASFTLQPSFDSDPAPPVPTVNAI